MTFFGGGFQRPINKDDASAPNLYDLTSQAGYTIVGSYDEAKQHIHASKLLLVPASDFANPNKGAGALPYAIDRQEGDLSLAKIVDIAVQHLSKHDRFFMMAEGGKIDYSGHGNDAATNIHEVMDLDQAIQVAYQFYLQHPDETLIVVTADHETGGLYYDRNNTSSQTIKKDIKWLSMNHSRTRVDIAVWGDITTFVENYSNKFSELEGLPYWDNTDVFKLCSTYLTSNI